MKLLFIQWPIAEPWTSILIPMNTWIIFKWGFGYHMLSYLVRDTLQNPRWDISVSTWLILMLTIPVSSLPVSFFFLVDMFRHPSDLVTCVRPYDDGCTKRALRIYLHRRKSKFHSWTIRSFVKLPVSMKVVIMIKLLQMTFESEITNVQA